MKLKYSMIIQWSDEDQVYVVTLPEFPYCQTHGSTYEEAAQQGQEVLETLIETHSAAEPPLPEPMTLDATGSLWGHELKGLTRVSETSAEYEKSPKQ